MCLGTPYSPCEAQIPLAALLWKAVASKWAMPRPHIMHVSCDMAPFTWQWLPNATWDIIFAVAFVLATNSPALTAASVNEALHTAKECV